jgi:hypothetical protein
MPKALRVRKSRRVLMGCELEQRRGFMIEQYASAAHDFRDLVPNLPKVL